MGARKASIKETGEELSQEAWERFEKAASQAEDEAPPAKKREQDEVVERTKLGKTPRHK